MIHSHINLSTLPIDLGEGLILRRSRVEDAERLADFNAMIHTDEPGTPDERCWAWSYDLLAKPHPTFDPGDFTIVEEASTGRIISSMNLIPQTWTYAGIPFKVGRPELVGTLPEYRGKGLVRLQFEVIHKWSAEKGEKLQAITGIPYYYRLFGYEMAMNLGGGRAGYPTHIPRLKESEQEPYSIRLATEADIPFIAELFASGCKQSLVACEWDDDLWRYELCGKSEKNVNRLVVCLIETTAGEKAGFFNHPFFSWGDAMVLLNYEITSGFSWREVTPSVIRYLEKVYHQYNPDETTRKPFGAFGFWLGEEHPVYHIITDRLPRIRKPYAWFLRLADVPDFLHLITPVLEKRLAESCMSGYTGEINLTFYREGVRMVLEKGRMITIEAWKPTPVGNSGNAGFPPHTFLQLLFGYRSLDMLKTSFADCWTDRDETHALLNELFPRQPSDLMPVS